jgi:hypothetical protein
MGKIYRENIIRYNKKTGRIIIERVRQKNEIVRKRKQK